MKRKYRQTQIGIDEACLDAITNGETSNAQLKQVIKQVGGRCTMDEMLDRFASSELSALKQRLRAAGHIEITTDNQPILISAISQDDAEFIDQRRRAHIQGELKTRVEFNTRHGRSESAEEASRQLSMFESNAKIANEVPVGHA